MFDYFIEPSISPFSYTNVQCIGIENGLTNCIHNKDTATCDQSLIASVVCTDDNGTPKTTLRLLDETAESEGRLEIRFADLWGEVCFSEWGEEEANVACRQLGFRNSIQYRGISPPSNTILWLSGVKCSGSETTLTHCSHDGWGQGQCTATVWLKCSGNVSQSMMEDSITPHSEIPIACESCLALIISFNSCKHLL